MAVRNLKGSWWVDFRHRGIRYRKRSPLNTKGGAREYESVLRGRLARGEPVEGLRREEPPGAVRFDAFVDRWFATNVVPYNKPSEQQTKRILLRRHLLPCFGPKRLSELTAATIAEYRAAKVASGLAPKSVNNHLAVLRACLNAAVRWELLERCPSIEPLKTDPPDFDYLRSHEVRLLLSDSEGGHWNAMVRIAVRTGLRLGELLALDWQDVDLVARRITVRHSCWQGHITTTKSWKIRHVGLTADAVGAFAALGPACGFVFKGQDGGPVAKETARRALHGMCRRVGLRSIGWHVLRHTFASTLACAGTPMTFIQTLLGHSSIKTTQRYAHLAPSVLAGAIAALERANADPAPGPLGNQWSTWLPNPMPSEQPAA